MCQCAEVSAFAKRYFTSAVCLHPTDTKKSADALRGPSDEVGVEKCEDAPIDSTPSLHRYLNAVSAVAFYSNTNTANSRLFGRG
jgi:hypothetical protein